jgi:hypothetical protein
MEPMSLVTVSRPRPLLATALVAVLAGLAMAACGGPVADRATSTGQQAGGGSDPQYTVQPGTPVVTSPYEKVMVIAEENEAESAVIGSSQAPYITRLAATYGRATNMQANYPVTCPSLAAYIIITSGSRQGICDDLPPANHPLPVDNIFKQVKDAGLEWRQYAESMTTNCQQVDGPPGGYLVRHAPPPYYSNVAPDCNSWDVPLGTTTAGNLHNALAAGLPDYSFVTPNACNDMHGASTCPTLWVKRGDNWLARWMPQIIASDDFQQARLAVVITWDEGSTTSNHIPTLIVARTVNGVQSGAAYTHCSTLRVAEDVLGLPRLGCAATAPSFRSGFDF